MLQLDEPKMEVAAVVGKLTRALPKWPFHTYLSWIFCFMEKAKYSSKC